MFPKINPTKTAAWAALSELASDMHSTRIDALFAADSNRVADYSIEIPELLFFDYSKNKITRKVLNELINLANQTKLASAIEAMFTGEIINETEKRAVLHTALRQQNESPVYLNGENIIPQIISEKERFLAFAEKVFNGHLFGYSGKQINTLVNIGIGGSDLGPVMVSEALRPFHNKSLKAHFVSNIDGAHLHETLAKIDAETTLFFIASKTFTTQETMTNAQSARAWFLQYLPENAIQNHFVALSTNHLEVAKFGITKEQTFGFWDWVGGRYSVWSSIGLPVACLIGPVAFNEFLRGAALIDTHLREKPFLENIPVLMALIGIWNTNFLNAASEAILPYDQYLHRFPAYLQQANMESNGKQIDRNREIVNYKTGPIIWGEPGTNGQHAFYQLIHQGTQLIPCDFIAAAIPNHELSNHHTILLANFFAQTRALMVGKSSEEVKKELKSKQISGVDLENLTPHKVFPGNIPTNSFLLKTLNPKTLGMLVALYEHKIFVQGVIWNVFSFDQWGVELGKQLANEILPEINLPDTTSIFDQSTNTLINKFKNWTN